MSHVEAVSQVSEEDADQHPPEGGPVSKLLRAGVTFAYHAVQRSKLRSQQTSREPKRLGMEDCTNGRM
jgi:hypothetical protein